MSDNWVVSTLNFVFSLWNDKIGEMWSLITTSPQEFKGGDIWRLIVNINGALSAIAYALLILFFAMGVFRSTTNFQDFKRPETALKLFLKFVIEKVAITYSMDIMTTVFNICGGIIGKISETMGAVNTISLPSEITTAIESVSWLASIPLWIVSALGCLLIIGLTFVMIFTVYGRFFRLYMYTAIAPIPLATFAGDTTSNTGKTFLKSYIGVCMEGAIIVLACMIFSAFANSGALTIPSASMGATTMVWAYLGEVIFLMFTLVGLIKASDRVVKEMLAL